MIKALKVWLIIFGAVHILVGLTTILIPAQWAAMGGVAQITDYERWLLALLGACFIAIGVWVIVAGRNPLSHINWIKFAILKSALTVVVGVYLIIQGYIDFSQVGAVVILDAVFTIALLACYPWRAARLQIR
jgi:energy-converting hydrogenase Eha subunit C